MESESQKQGQTGSLAVATGSANHQPYTLGATDEEAFAIHLAEKRKKDSNRRLSQYAVFHDGWECPRCGEHHDPGCGNCNCGYTRQ